MSYVIQQKGLTAQLFSSALFCLWLSTASLVVWLDMEPGSAASPASASEPQSQRPPVLPAGAVAPEATVTAASDGLPDIA